MRLADPVTPSGTLDRRAYVRWGLSLLAVKFLIDWAVSRFAFGRSWSVFQYLFPGRAITALTGEDRVYWLTLLAISLPFLWAGVVLTLKRLRSLSWSPLLVLLFVVPGVNLLLFALLSTLWGAREPERVRAVRARRARRERGEALRAFPDAALAVVMWLPVGAANYWLAIYAFGDYGWGIFVLMPVTLGFAVALVCNRFGRRRSSSTVVGCLFASVLGMGACLAFGFEGALCLAMAAPLCVPAILVGGVIGEAVVGDPSAGSRSPRTLASSVLVVPVFLGAEKAAEVAPPTVAVTTAIVIHAPPERVWRHVVSFAEIPEPDELLFRAGIAYPVRAEIEGDGVGAVRRCRFTTGSFVEPIEVWDAPRLLRFSVVECPPPMREWSPYGEIVAPHLEGNFVATRGEFRLIELAGGATRLEGTTWYHQRLWPAPYWRLWADHIVRLIHQRVLRHIEAEAEG